LKLYCDSFLSDPSQFIVIYRPNYLLKYNQPYVTVLVTLTDNSPNCISRRFNLLPYFVMFINTGQLELSTND